MIGKSISEHNGVICGCGSSLLNCARRKSVQVGSNMKSIQANKSGIMLFIAPCVH